MHIFFLKSKIYPNQNQKFINKRVVNESNHRKRIILYSSIFWSLKALPKGRFCVIFQSNKTSINLIFPLIQLFLSYYMKILGTKALKNTLNPLKSEKTTAINSETGSRKNSTFFELSRDSQKILPSLSNFIPQLDLPSNKKNRQCLKLTVNQNKSHCIQTERMRGGQRKQKKSIFNFCQEVPKEQNLYMQIINSCTTQRLELGPRKQLILKKSMNLEPRNKDLTLTTPQSPINKLIKLDTRNDEQIKTKEKSIVEWQRLLERV